MTVMFPEFFGMPQSVIRTRLWAQMKARERTLYTVLLHESERYCSRQLQRTDAELSELSGVCTRSIRDARIKLQEYGLVRSQRGRGNVYTYTMCNPETGQPWPGNPKSPIAYIKKADRLPVGPTVNDIGSKQLSAAKGVPLSFNSRCKPN